MDLLVRESRKVLSFGVQADSACVLPLTALFFIEGSVPSLAAGLLFGGLAGLGAYQQSKDPKNVWLSLGKFARQPSTECYWWRWEQ